jgi:hypothetical protein
MSEWNHVVTVATTAASDGAALMRNLYVELQFLIPFFFLFRFVFGIHLFYWKLNAVLES